VVRLLEAVTSTMSVSVRSWVLVFHTLCLLTNQRLDATSPQEDEGAGGGGWLMDVGAGVGSMWWVVLTDANLVPLIIKFLSSSTSSSSAGMFYQVQYFGFRLAYFVIIDIHC
jgi:hypothetical protein